MAASKSKGVWRKDRIGAEDAETGLRAVTLPRVPGEAVSTTRAIFDFERPIIGTVAALIRVQKRASGVDVPLRAKIAAELSGEAEVPAEVRAHYA